MKFHKPSEIKDAILLAGSIIRKSVHKCPTTKDISRMVGLNEFLLKRQFKKKFGCGMYEYFLQQKMELAKKLLRTTDEPLKNIYRQVGYKGSTGFITAFKKQVGVTPNQFRLQQPVEEELTKYSHAELEKMIGHKFEYIFQ